MGSECETEFAQSVRAIELGIAEALGPIAEFQNGGGRRDRNSRNKKTPCRKLQRR